MARKHTRFTEGGSPIVSTRVELDAGGPIRYVDTTKEAAYPKDKDGFSYRVPIDKRRRVPLFAIIQHFMDIEGSAEASNPRNVTIDLRKNAKTVHEIPPGGFTPEQIIETGWWQDPSGSDILGVDDTTSSILGVWDDIGKSSKSKSARIVVMGTPSEQETITRVLRSNFTDAELMTAVKDCGILIIAGPTGRKNVGGFYMRRQAGSETPVIVVKDLSEDTITHEFIHHLRQTDPKRTGYSRTPYVLDDKGYVITGKGRSYESYSNLEEAGTVAEATTRTRKPTGSPTGYYWDVQGTPGGRSRRDAYDHDRELLTKGKTKSAPLRGKRAMDRVNERFMDTDISKLKVKGKGARADRFAQQLQADLAPKEPPKQYAPGELRRIGKGEYETYGPDGRHFFIFSRGKGEDVRWYVVDAAKRYVDQVNSCPLLRTKREAQEYAKSLMSTGVGL